MEDALYSKNPLISVIVPVYNAKKYIEDCIISILGQSYTNFELILIDDCSTDGSLEFVQENFHDPRMKFFKNEKNFGNGFTRNAGIKLARGKYLCFVDNDDLILENALQTYLNEAEKYSADVVHATKYYAVQHDQLKLGATVMAADIVEKESTFGLLPKNISERFKNLGTKTFFPEWMNFYKREFLINKQIFIPEVRLASDVFFLMAILLTAKRFVKIDEQLYCYRLKTPESITASSTEKHLHLFLQDLPEMILYSQNLFERNDLIENISLRDQNALTANALMEMHKTFFFGTMKYYPQNTEVLLKNICSEAVSSSKYSNPKFLAKFIQIFFEIASRTVDETQK